MSGQVIVGALHPRVEGSQTPAAQSCALLNPSDPDEEKSFFHGLKATQKTGGCCSLCGYVDSNRGRKVARLLGEFHRLSQSSSDGANGVRISVDGVSQGHGFFFPFLGQVGTVDEVVDEQKVMFRLPPIEKVAVFWWKP